MKRTAPLIALMLAGCDLSMTKQDRHETQGSSSLWPAGPTTAPADGAVAQDQPARDAALTQPPALSVALLQRGRERYTIYCAPCHGADGAGRGPIVRRGFPQPARFGDARGDPATARHIVDVTTNGYGAMYGFDDRIEPADRWAIAAYVRVLAGTS